MGISNWTTIEKPRKKPFTRDIKNLSDAELLAIFIRKGKKNTTNINLAYSLLKKFGGIRNIFDANQKQLCNLPGIGRAKYIKLRAILEISHRYLKEQIINTNVVTNAETAYLFLISRLRDLEREVFACLFLNNQNRVIHYEELFYGSINSLTIHPREVAKTALKYNSSALIFAHNHPSGPATPSPEDQRLTNALTKILRPLDIKVLDHIIIGNNNYISLVDYTD